MKVYVPKLDFLVDVTLISLKRFGVKEVDVNLIIIINQKECFDSTVS